MEKDNTAIQEARTSSRAWAILAVTYLASITAPMAQLMTPPLADWIFSEFQIGGAEFGLQMSVVGWIGIILAFPAALISKRIGLKSTVLISVACIGIGALASAFVPSFELFLLTRILEGAGIGLIGVVAPTCISIWFPDKTRGLALGIWSTWFPFATVIIYAVAPSMAEALGFRSVFTACAILSLVAFVLFALVFRMPSRQGGGDAPQEESFGASMGLLKNKNIWLIGFAMCCFSFIGASWTNTFYPTYLNTEQGYTPVLASGMISIYTAVGLVLGPVSGALSDRLQVGSKRWVVFGGFIVYGIALLFAWPSAGDPNSTLFIWMAVIGGGVGSGLISAGIRPLAPLSLGNTPTAAAMSMAMLQFMQQLGLAIGPTVFGAAYGDLGWATASNFILFPLALIALVLMIFVKLKVKKS